ncbi:hypothetical protein [Acidocella sp.]|uniref:hypothetical protein n=1 Tax=Acidocella sp. TaxID=50710 RepID=UPI002624816D|nr:hypothetical protein [Acidocella sp.]
MGDHKKFTYVSPGANGKGHSEPEDISDTPFETIASSRESQEGLSFPAHIKVTAKAILSSLEGRLDDLNLLNSARGAILYRHGIESDDVPSESTVAALLTVEAFSDAFNVSYYALT